MKKAQGYQQCESEDYDPFNDCKPVNCELKYSGKRNFFKDPHCVSATVCDQGPNSIYDYDKNICRNFKEVLSPEDIEEMSEGRFSNWVDPVGQERNDRDLTEVGEGFLGFLKLSRIFLFSEENHVEKTAKKLEWTHWPCWKYFIGFIFHLQAGRFSKIS